jgi:hypothetical protein
VFYGTQDKEIKMRILKKPVKSLLVFILVFFAFCFYADSASGELYEMGPVNPATNFPFYYMDENGLALELCLTPPDAGPPCFFDPVIPDNPLSVSTGFGGEAFWFLAGSAINSGGFEADLDLAIEAAYGTEDPVPNTQVSFARVRVRIDVPDGNPTGDYIITHPYGTLVFKNIAPGNRAINYTGDIGIGELDFTGALRGRIGPFLRIDPADPNYASITSNWPGYIGDSGTLVKVVGSPFGTDYFRIQGPGGVDLQQDFFSLMGKLYTGTVLTPLSVERVSYSRSAAAGNPGQIDIFTRSAPSAFVTASGNGIPLTQLKGDGAGNFFAHIRLASATVLPATLNIIADNSKMIPNNIPNSVSVPVTDFVTVRKAEFNPISGNLSIEAASGDEMLSPVLNAVGYSDLIGGVLSVSTNAPLYYTDVLSSSGGADFRRVNVLRPE